jgi:hypothetical protein
MTVRILAHELDGQEASAHQARVVIGPQPAGGALAIAFDEHPRHFRRFSRIVAVFDDVLETEPIRLVFQLALVSVHDRGDAKFGHEQAGIADKRARRYAGDDQANALASRFLDFAPVVHLQDVSNFMTENECKLGFVIDCAKQPGIDEQRAVGQ